MKRFFSGSAILLLALLFLGSMFQGALAQETGFTGDIPNETKLDVSNETEQLEIHYFWMKGCPHCEDQKEFLDQLIEEYPSISIHEYRLIPPEEGAENALYTLAEKHGVEITRIVAPMSFVGSEFFVGYSSQTGIQIKKIVEEKFGFPVEKNNSNENNDYVVDLPVFGQTDLSVLSLPLLAFLLGSFDGLNVCSIGALLLVLAIVLKFNSRKKIIFYGGLFLLVTAIAYGSLVFLWYGIMNYLIGYFDVISLFIGLAALAGGIHFFREFLKFYKYGPTCETSSSEFLLNLQRKVQNKLLGENTGTVAMITAIVLFAVAVTIVELPCSVALPLVFSAILVDAGLGSVEFAFYIVVYLFFYLLIELIVFGAAIYTKELWYGPEKSITWVTLLASLVMIGIGIYYLYPLIPI